MAAAAKRNDHRYRTPGVIDGSLARDLSSYELERRLEESGQLDFDQEYRRPQITEADKLSQRRAETKAAVRPAQKVSPMFLAGCIAVGAMMLALLLSYVEINGISGNIVKMKAEISRLEADQISLEARHEQAFDTATVKNAAMAVGMGQPSESQVCYVSLPGEDKTVTYQAEETTFLSRVLTGLGHTAGAVAEYFR